MVDDELALTFIGADGSTPFTVIVILALVVHVKAADEADTV
jgi:hypothetical protein